MNTDGLVKMLRNRRAGSRNALLVGFNGSAALFGHSPIEGLLRDLFARNRDVPNAREMANFRPLQILGNWGELNNEERLALLAKHTRATRPDVEAIDAIVELCREGYIHLVLMSDPADNAATLMNRSERLWESYHCSRERPDLLTRLNADKRAIFVNASDVALEAFVPGIYDVDVQVRKEIHTSVRDVLKRFDAILCWGWCDYNVPLSTLVGSERHSLYLLSAASDCSKTMMEGNPAQIVDDGQSEFVTTDILKAIKRQLFPGTGRSTNGAPAPGLRVAQATTGGLRPHDADLCLLWDDASRSEILEQAKRVRISLIGVEGDLVRSRVAFATSATLVRDGARCFWRPGADLLALDRVITARSSAAYKQRSYLVIELMPLKAGNFITRFLAHWHAKLQETKHLHLIAFTDLDALRPVTREAAGLTLQHKVLTAAACLTVPNIASWVHRVFESSLRSSYEIGPTGFSEFAFHAREALPKVIDGADLDWAHDAFGQWLSEVSALGADSEDKLTLQTWKDTWSRIAASHAIVHQRRQVTLDFDSDDVGDPDPPATQRPTIAGTADAIDDFDLGSIRKRPRAAKSHPRKDPP